VDTLRTLQAENPSAELWFLTGTDAIADLPRWRDPEEVLRLTRFAVATRAGTTVEEARAKLAHLPGAWQDRISFFPMTNIDISSTDIRSRLATGRSYVTVADGCGAIYRGTGFIKTGWVTIR
jgi:nicotinate-nucleotide adenylyltransferase